MSIYFTFYTNIFFLLPIVSAWYQSEWIYFFLAVSICIMSTWFHALELRGHRYFSHVRKYDITLASICYLYMIYFAYTYLMAPRMSIAFGGLILSLGVYAYSKMQREKDREYIWHGVFHIIIGVVSGCIVLLK